MADQQDDSTKYVYLGNTGIVQNADPAYWQPNTGVHIQQGHDQEDGQGDHRRTSTDARSGSFDESFNRDSYDDELRKDVDRSTMMNDYFGNEAQPVGNRLHFTDKPNKSSKLGKKRHGKESGKPKSSDSARAHKHQSDDHHHRHKHGKKDHHK